MIKTCAIFTHERVVANEVHDYRVIFVFVILVFKVLFVSFIPKNLLVTEECY
jgi:hypothetical protein